MIAANKLKYKRVLIKLSGGALKGSGGDNFDVTALEHIVQEVLSIKAMGIEVALVTGGGNIFRGNTAEYWGVERAEADDIGMLGTVMNALMLKAALQHRSTFEIRVMTAINIEAMTEPYIRRRARNHLVKKYIIILAAGIGQPFVTTDYTGAQRAIELNCDAMFVAKHGVNGVLDSDPQSNPNAKLYRTLAYNDFLQNQLNVMDHSAILLARDHKLPVHIFNFDRRDTMKQLCLGNDIGTYVDNSTKMELY